MTNLRKEIEEKNQNLQEFINFKSQNLNIEELKKENIKSKTEIIKYDEYYNQLSDKFLKNEAIQNFLISENGILKEKIFQMSTYSKKSFWC